MSTWNKVLVGLIVVATLGYAYLAAKAFKRQEELRTSIASDRAQLEGLEQQNRVALEGEEGNPGTVDLDVALNNALASRGRIWENAAAVVNADGTVTVTVAAPTPHQINSNLTLFVFDAPGDPGLGKYLGEFKVTAVAENLVTLAPALKPTAAEQERLAAAGGRGWTLYDLMPLDNRTWNRGLTVRGKNLVPAPTAEQQLALITALVAAMLPSATPEHQAELAQGIVRQLEKDGQPAEDGDPTDRIDPETKVYHRPLLDFATLFHEYERQRTLLGDAIAAAQLQKDYVEKALADAREQQTFMEQLKAQTQERLAQVTRERDAVASHREELVASLAETREAIQRFLAENRRLAAALAKYQFEATAVLPATDDPAPAP